MSRLREYTDLDKIDGVFGRMCVVSTSRFISFVYLSEHITHS